MGSGQILAVLLSAALIRSFFSTLQETKYSPPVAKSEVFNKEMDGEEVVEQLHLIEWTAWFRSLSALNFGVAVQFAAEVLYRFPVPAISNAMFDLSGPNSVGRT